MTKRLDSVNVKSTPENRLSFRQTLLVQAVCQIVLGVILYDETIKQKISDEKNIPELIQSVNSIQV